MDELNFTFKMPDDETLAKYISIKGEKGEAGNPTKLSQLENDTGFVTASTDALTNYYTKAQTDSAIDADVEALETELGVPDGFFTDETETISGEGTIITLNDTANNLFKDIKLYGDTVQDDTPTPDSPVLVQTVTGDQTIIISDNAHQSQSYTLSLGDIELCEIGEYQDSIYKSGDDWYLKKQIGKVSVDTSTISIIDNYSNIEYAELDKPNDFIGYNNYNNYFVWCSHASYEDGGSASFWNNADRVGHIYTRAQNKKLWVGFTKGTGIDSMQTALTGCNIYYRLTTPTITKITDRLLVKQLEALSLAKSYNDITQIIANGNLPAILSVATFKNNWNGTISGIHNEVNSSYTKYEVNSLLENIDDELIVSFPIYGAEGTDTLGDCTILKSKNKSMMIDCFSTASSNTYTSIQQALSNLGLSKIDYMLITHYHADHYGNIYNLINGGYLDEAIVVLPRVSSNFSGFNGQAIKDALDSANITWVECENQTIMLDEVKVELFNGSAEDYAYYDAYEGDIEVQYNDYSIYCNVTFGDKKLLFTGDGDLVSTGYVTSRYLKSGYDLLKSNHHGFIKFDPNYAKKVNPKYVVIPASVGMVNLNLSRWGVDSGYWSLSTSHIYFQGYQSEPIKFSVKRNNISLKSEAYSVQQYSGAGIWNYYVDGTTTNLIRTGSAEYPFKTLAEAAAMTPKNTVYRIVINVINLDADNYDVHFEGFDYLGVNFNNIQFTHELRFTRCKMMSVSNLNTSGTVSVSGCSGAFVNFTSTATTDAAITIQNHSVITFTGDISAIGYAESLFRIGQGSTVYFTISSLTTTIPSGKRILNCWGSYISFTKDSIDVFKNFKFLEEITYLAAYKENSFSENVKDLMVLFEANSTTYSGITTKEAVSNYPYYKVLTANTSNHQKITTHVSGKTANINHVFMGTNGNEVYIQSVLISTSGTSVTLARNGEMDIYNNGNNPTAVSANKIGILKIWGVIE